MLVPSRLYCLLLLLFLFLADLSTRSVRCQNVVLSKVRSDYVEVTWNKTGYWFGAENFTVTINTALGLFTKVTTCTNEPCKFNSEDYGSLHACSDNNLTVSGNNILSEPIIFQTAPEPVTDLDVQVVEGVLHISWTNPSNESSTCYNYTAVKVRDASFVDKITYHPITEESVEVPQCEGVLGTVNAWTIGGDGRSTAKYFVFNYSGDAVVDLVTAKTCQPFGCFGIELAWDYNPLCPDVTHFCVESPDTGITCTENTASTNIKLTGLVEDKKYDFYIYAYGKNGKISHPAYQTCSTHDTAVTNLMAVSTSPTSLNATWDSPMCLPAEGLKYEISCTTHGCPSDPQNTTTETSYMWTHLEDFEKYYVCVAREGNELVKKVACHTLPRRLTWLRLGMAGDDSVLVQWEEITDYIDSPRYILTWGSEAHYTEGAEYTIKGYNSTEALGLVCVAVFMEHDLSNVTGPTRCSDDPGEPDPPPPGPSNSPDTLLIVLLSVGIPAVIIAVLGVIFVLRKRHLKAIGLPAAHSTLRTQM